MTMTWIMGQTLSTDGSFAFSSIPQTFTHLQLRISVRSSRSGFADEWFLTRLNSDAGNNYASHTLRGYSTGASTGADNNAYVTTSFSFVGFAPPNQLTSNIFAGYVMDVLDYQNTNKFKTIRSIGGYDTNGAASINAFATLASGVWMNTAAVTSISLIGNASLLAGSRADLYGITVSSVTGA